MILKVIVPGEFFDKGFNNSVILLKLNYWI